MIKNLLQFGSLEAVTRAINWSMMMLLPLLVSKSHYGEISLFISLLGICGAIMSLGLNRAILRLYDPQSRTGSILQEVLILQSILFVISLAAALALLALGQELIEIRQNLSNTPRPEISVNGLSTWARYNLVFTNP